MNCNLNNKKMGIKKRFIEMANGLGESPSSQKKVIKESVKIQKRVLID